ncbi:peptidyl-prolyl cis-trans isomerase, partial [Entophlyctis helioformis]
SKTVLKKGDGVNFPAKASGCCLCVGWPLLDGTKFDSSRDRNKTFSTQIGVGQVIKGWDEGIVSMSIGERSMLTIKPEYAYGDRGAGGVIPPGATLKFD